MFACVVLPATTPHAPYNLSVSTTQFAATISWLPGYNGGFRQHYVLWYRMQDGSQQRWMTIRVIPAKVTSITVYKLYPDMMYQFMVLSRNQLGDGFFSEIVAIKTKGYDPLLASALPADKYGKTYIPPIIKTIGPKPAPPRNLTVRQLSTGLFISWLPPYDLTVPVQYYKVYYRTVGPWVPLTGEITDKTTYLWKTVSRGATYQFQVYSYSKLAHSEPSKPVTHSTIGTQRKGVQMSMAFVGVVIGGVFSVFTAIMLIIMCIKYYFRRRQRKNAKKYGNVKYFGPNQVDSNSIRFTGKFRTTRGGRSPVDSNTRRHGRVSTLYHSAWRCLLGVRRSLRLCRHHGDTQSEWELYEGQAKEPLAPIYRTVEGKFVFGNIYSSSGPQPVEELADVLTQKSTERVNHNYNEVSPRDLSATLCPVSSRGDRCMCVTSSPQYDTDRGRFFLNDVSSIALLPFASDNWSPDPSQVKDSLYREMSNNLNLFRESQWQKHNSASWLSDYKYCWSGAPPGAYCQKVTRYPQGSSVTVQDNGTGSSTSSRPVMYTREKLSHTIDKSWRNNSQGLSARHGGRYLPQIESTRCHRATSVSLSSGFGSKDITQHNVKSWGTHNLQHIS
ncbi:Protein turtle [Lamellibrachia satsuma]|nr:Protein turtle [Lamellibrachia satsuma]